MSLRVEGQQPHRAPTLDAVAAVAGVSRSTVSRVVNGSSQVAPHVIEAVNRAIVELHYVPNRAARSLATNRQQTLALVLPTNASAPHPVPYFASLMQSISRHVTQAGYALSVVSPTKSRLDESRNLLSGGDLGGALVIACASSDDFYAELGATLPLIFVGAPATERPIHRIDTDHAAGAYALTEHLIERGRRHLATIAGPPTSLAAVERLAGWRAALAAHGHDDSLVEHGDFTPVSGATAMRRFLAREEPIDAVFIANDQMAAGAYSAIHDAGLRIPEDIAVAGFDNDDYFGSTAIPALTTFDQRTVALAETAVRTLIDLVSGRTVERIIRVPGELIIREST